VDQTNEAAADKQAPRDSLTSLEKERERETRFISEYMALNGCTEAAARAVYMQLFSQPQRTETS
jgi:hypothetical protein